jgi:8-oxo-dGTP pyrophosphatase MutT (NUDIX family)
MPHLFYYLDYTVSVFVVNDGRVLLVDHKQLNRWLPLGGHIDPNEDPQTAALRETREESGLEVELIGSRPPDGMPGTTPLTAPSYLDIHDIKGEHRHLGMIYFARSSADAVHLAGAEHREIRWFAADELDDPAWGLLDSIRFYAKEALRRAASEQPVNPPPHWNS